MANSSRQTTGLSSATGTTSLQSQSRQLHGYHRMARMMGRSDELAIFRKFNDVNMLSLLSLQAEILELRDDLYDVCEADEKSGTLYSMSMLELLHHKKGRGKIQYEAIDTIRAKISQYNALLLQVAELSKLNQPRTDYLKSLRDWLMDTAGGRSNGVFRGKEAFIWDKEDVRGEKIEHDLVTLSTPKGERDVFTKWVIYPILDIFHQLWGRRKLNKRYVLDEESGYVEYSEEKIDRIGKIISTTVASILPVIAVLGLFFIKSLVVRIYAMIGITSAFAILLASMSNGKRIEIFAAVATFAAVEVVFIGSNSSYLGGKIE